MMHIAAHCAHGVQGDIGTAHAHSPYRGMCTMCMCTPHISRQTCLERTEGGKDLFLGRTALAWVGGCHG